LSRLRILGRVTSSNVRKVLWTADLIGLDYEHEDWGLPLRDPKVPEFVSLNPNGTVPVIIDDGFVLWESSAIMRYLARTCSALWPEDVRERALVDQWLTWQATELLPSWLYAVTALLAKNPDFVDPVRIAESVSKWSANMRMLETRLAEGSGFVANGRLSLADLALALSSHRWFSTPLDRPELPAVKEHYERLKATEAGRKYMGAATL
jgi:glutathione S-transferase